MAPATSTTTTGTVRERVKNKPLYTVEEVLQHNTANDCWIIINKRVYNVTSWIPRHPGGEQVSTLTMLLRGPAYVSPTYHQNQ